jgi:hypothetical protein
MLFQQAKDQLRKRACISYSEGKLNLQALEREEDEAIREK